MAEKPAKKGTDTVLITHPKVKAKPARTTRDALEKVWGPKGWVEYDPNKTTDSASDQAATPKKDG